MLLFVLFFSLLVLPSCNTDSASTESKETECSLNNSSVESAREDTEGDLTTIKLFYKSTPENEMVLSDKQAEYILSIWDNNEWSNGTTKTICDYHFKFDEKLIKYSPEGGVFNDLENNRCLILSEEVCDSINSIVSELGR
jgi:hypothetical protein